MTIPDSFIKEKIAFWSKKIGVTKQVFFLTDFREWTKLVEQQRQKKRVCKMPFGATTTPKTSSPLIFINKIRNNSKKEMTNTILHELIHIKNPSMPELTVRKETRRILKQK